jgi:hypothetical protein
VALFISGICFGGSALGCDEYDDATPQITGDDFQGGIRDHEFGQGYFRGFGQLKGSQDVLADGADVSVGECVREGGCHHLASATDRKTSGRNLEESRLGGLDEELCYERHGVNLPLDVASLKGRGCGRCICAGSMPASFCTDPVFLSRVQQRETQGVVSHPGYGCVLFTSDRLFYRKMCE